MLNIIKNQLIHSILPSILILLSIFNEKYYLQPEVKTLIPLYFIRVIIFLLGFFISKKIVEKIIYYKNLKSNGQKILLTEKQKMFLVTFIWFISWYGFWLFVYYPGSYLADTLDAIRQISFMEVNDWFSYVHPLTYLFLYQFYPDIIVIGIAQITLCAFIFADIISFLYSQFKLKFILKSLTFILFIAFISSITSITYYAFFYMRDIPFSLLHLYLAFYIYKITIENKTSEITKDQCLFIIGLGLFLAIFRGEGIIILIVTLLCLLFYGKVTKKLFTKLLVGSLVSFLFLNLFLPKILNVYATDKNHYNLTLVAYPLGFILNNDNHYISGDEQEDKKILSNIIKVEGIKTGVNCYDITTFQHENNLWNRDTSDESWSVFYTRVYKIFWDNPHLFLAARTCNFIAHLFLFDGKVERDNDSGRYSLTKDECFINKDNKWCALYFSDVMYTILKMLPSCDGVCGYTSLMKLKDISYNWHWNSIFAFLTSIIVLILYKFLPISAMFSAIILSRIPIVFLTAPYVFFRYIYSLYLAGVFILLLVILECIKNKKERQRSSSKRRD